MTTRPVEPRLGDPRRARPDQGAAERRGKREPAERPPRPSAAKHEAERRRGRPPRHRKAGHCALRIEREPARDPASETDHEPRRKLRALRLEELLQLLASRGKPRLPIAPSTLWKRRFPYVRGARPLHCSMKLEEESALERKRE